MLFKKILRDMKDNKGQFISIFIMAVLSILVYAGINAEWNGMETEANRYYDESKLPDIWIMGEYFDYEDIEDIKKIDGILEAVPRLSFDSVNDDKSIRVNIIEEDTISIPLVVGGKRLEGSRDGLWLDNSFASANDIRIGEDIEIKIGDKSINKTVLGFILHPEYVYSNNDKTKFMPDDKGFGFAFLYSSSLDKEYRGNYNQILISRDLGKDENKLIEELEYLFSDRYSIIINRESHLSVSSFSSEIEQQKAMGGVFPLVFFAIAMLSMLTTMTRIINNQRVQIGILKALGFSKRKILFHYISYGIWIGLLGGVAGLVIGPLIIPPIIFGMQKNIYTLPDWPIKLGFSSFLVVVVLVFSCALISYLACRKELVDVPANSLRPKAPKDGGYSIIERTKFWRKMDFKFQWNFRDIMRSKIRSLMTLMGITGCTALLVLGFGLRDTINSVSTWMYGELNIYENKINLKEGHLKKDIKELSHKYGGQWIQESNIELKNNDKKENAFLTVLDKGNNIIFKNERREKISLPTEGIGLSYKMAGVFKVGVGDSIKWRVFGEKDWRKSKISIIYRTPIGQGISISKEEYERMGGEFHPTSLLILDKIKTRETFEGLQSIQNKKGLMEEFDSILDNINMIVIILILAAIILGSVVLYNLESLSFTEKTRELATLKVLGFSYKQIRGLLQMQNIWLTIMGIIIGIPTGYGLIAFMLSTMPNSLDMIADVSNTSVMISVLITFIISVSTNFILSKNIRQIDMVTALKSVE